jgi:hypothetical protein
MYIFEAMCRLTATARTLAALNDKTRSTRRINNDNERADQWRSLSGGRASRSSIKMLV